MYVVCCNKPNDLFCLVEQIRFATANYRARPLVPDLQWLKSTD